MDCPACKSQFVAQGEMKSGNCWYCGSEISSERKKAWLRELIQVSSESELRIIYAIIGGKLGKRKISATQQAKMQAARKRKVI